MKIQTTVNIKKELLNRLESASKILNVPKSQLISRLLEVMMEKCPVKTPDNTRVRYQKRDKNTVWHKLHVTYDYDMYEKSLDLRKICKMSVSLIIEEGIKKYLDLIISDKTQDSDKPGFGSNYVFIQNMSKSCYSYTVFWGFPGNAVLKKLLE